MTILAKWKEQSVFWLWNVIFAASIILAFTGAQTLQPFLSALRQFFAGIALAAGVISDDSPALTHSNAPLEMWHYWEFAAFFSTLVFNILFLYVGWFRKRDKQDPKRGRFAVAATAQHKLIVICLLFFAAFLALLLAITVSVVDGKCWIQVLCVLAVTGCFLKIDRIMSEHAEDEGVKQDFSASVRLNDQPAVLAFCVLLVFAVLRFPTADIKKVTEVENGLSSLKVVAERQRSSLADSVKSVQKTVTEWKKLEEKKFRGFIGGAIAFQMLLSNTVLALIFREKGEASMRKMKSVPKRLLALLIAGAILVGWLWWKAHPPPGAPDAGLLGRPLRVGVVSWPGYAGGIVANNGFKSNKECIFWNNYKLLVEFVLLEDVDARAKAFARGGEGGIDITWSTVDFWANELPGFINNGVKAQAIMQVDWSHGGDAIVADKSINRIEDLKGKKTSLALFTPSHWLFEYSLQKSSLSEAEQDQIVKSIVGKNASPDARQDFVAGKVDAAVVWEPDVTQALKERSGSHILKSSTDFPDIIADIMVAREEFISQHPDVIRAFIRGWFDGTEKGKRSPDQVVQLLRNNESLYESLGADVTKEGLYTVKWADLSDNAKMFGLDGSEPIFDRIFTQASQAWTNRGYIKQAVAPSQAKDDRFLREMCSATSGSAPLATPK